MLFYRRQTNRTGYVMAHDASRDRHSHLCDECGRLWSHSRIDVESLGKDGKDAAHKCPGCGRYCSWVHRWLPDDETLPVELATWEGEGGRACPSL